MKHVSTASLLVILLLLAGCGHASTTKNNSKSSSGTSKDTGKVYTPDSKGNGGQKGPAAGGQTGSGSNAPLPSPADTINNKASAASDAGLPTATRGQVVMTPGAPVAHSPGKQ